MEKTIREMCVEYGCDKAPEIRHNYAQKYDELFAPIKHDVKKILEIGVGYPELMQRFVAGTVQGRDYKYFSGVSLHIWKEFFPNAMVYGIDIHPEAVVNGVDRIKTFTGDSSNNEWIAGVMKEVGQCDIIIDDGSHYPGIQLKTAQLLLPYVKKGGMYFIEDINRPDWLRRKLAGWNYELIVNTKKGDTLLLIKP